MAPLSAASMESYTRAYPYLVRLHMLQELADAAMLLQEGSVAAVTGPHERQRRLRWEERLRVTQSSLAVQVRAVLCKDLRTAKASYDLLRKPLQACNGCALERFSKW